MIRSRAFAVGAFLLAAAGTARAQEASPPAPIGQWSEGPARPFLAGRVDAGLYLRAIGAAGWGKPHWMWGGAQAQAITSYQFGAVAGGVRLNLLAVDVEVDLRRTRSYRHRFLDPVASHRSSGLTARGLGLQDYGSLDVDLSGPVPTPGGLAFWEVMWVSVLDAPAGVHVYEEWNHVVQGRDSVTFKLGWLASLFGTRLRVGPVGEAIALPGRGAAVWRAGLAGTWRITPRLELVGIAAIVVDSPDRLALLDGMDGSLALRGTWATGP
ncbi:MAG TPA: hypothetical protein VLT47_07800 [Anaeromyxobacteraceae bacterium]|nr:hypothetical protein [Anaeromyxobacteraceae bacterium]